MDNIELLIQDNTNSDIYDISDIVEGTITWSTERLGEASNLEFSIIPNGELSFYEGSIVRFKYHGNNIFYGFVFSKSRNKDNVIKVVACDQLRYLKNKETYVFQNKKASEVLIKIANDWELKTGNIDDTGYVIPSMVEDNQSLLDIIYKANDLTLLSTKKLYVLFDNFGKLDLRNVENLKTDLIIDGQTNLIDFDYSSSINDTYNQIKLVKKDKSGGSREVYIVKDSSTIAKWGKLQYYENVDDSLNEAQIIERANKSLSLYNRVNRKLSIPVIGDVRARAGFSIFINKLNLGDIVLNQFMLIEKATHSFSNNDYTMNLELRVI